MTCETCPFWAEPRRTSLAGDEKSSLVSECRVEAPQLLGLDSKLKGRWPITSSVDWCGRHPQRKSGLPLVQIG